jgi:hypothetical protein
LAFGIGGLLRSAACLSRRLTLRNSSSRSFVALFSFRSASLRRFSFCAAATFRLFELVVIVDPRLASPCGRFLDELPRDLDGLEALLPELECFADERRLRGAGTALRDNMARLWIAIFLLDNVVY